MPAPPRPPPDAHALIADLRRQIEALTRSRTVVPVLAADPVLLVNGAIWIRSDTAQLCYVVAGVAKRLSGT